MMDEVIDKFNHLSDEEKALTKRIRHLLIKLESVCQEEKEFIVILNALDLLKEFYLKKINVND